MPPEERNHPNPAHTILPCEHKVGASDKPSFPWLVQLMVRNILLKLGLAGCIVPGRSSIGMQATGLQYSKNPLLL
jgi:hypothetical protein